jgi:hypothetical protein
MSGALSLFGNATQPLHAVPLQQLTAATAGGPFLPLAGGSMTGPLNYTATGATTSRAAQDRAAEVVNVKDYGAKCDGTTDDTTAVNAAISYVSSAGGGTVTFPLGTCLMLGAMVIPYTGTTSPTQAPIRLTGVGGNPDSYLGSRPPSVPIGGTVLDMRYAGTGPVVAKIDTRGSGILEIDHLTIIDGTPHASYSNTLFVQTTNTTLLIHDCRFRGDTGAAGTVCLQDCIRLGAIVTGGGLGTNAATAGFQGYGTKIDNNQQRIPRQQHLHYQLRRWIDIVRGIPLLWHRTLRLQRQYDLWRGD